MNEFGKQEGLQISGITKLEYELFQEVNLNCNNSIIDSNIAIKDFNILIRNFNNIVMYIKVILAKNLSHN